MLRYTVYYSVDVPVELGPITVYTVTVSGEKEMQEVVGEVKSEEAGRLGFTVEWLDTHGNPITYAVKGDWVVAYVYSAQPLHGKVTIQVKVDLMLRPDKVIAEKGVWANGPLRECVEAYVEPAWGLRSVYVSFKDLEGAREVRLNLHLYHGLTARPSVGVVLSCLEQRPTVYENLDVHVPKL